MTIEKTMEKYLVERNPEGSAWPVRDAEKKGRDKWKASKAGKIISKGTRVWEVTRTWYVYADKATEAIDRSKNWKHDKSSAKVLKKVPGGATII